MVDFKCLPNAKDRIKSIEIDDYVEGSTRSIVLSHRVIHDLIEYREHPDNLVSKYNQSRACNAVDTWIKDCFDKNRNEYFYLTKAQYKWACAISNKIYKKLHKNKITELSYIYILKLKDHIHPKLGVSSNIDNRMRGIHKKGCDAFNFYECYRSQLVARDLAFELENELKKNIKVGVEYSPSVEGLYLNYGKTEWFKNSEIMKIKEFFMLKNMALVLRYRFC